MPTRIIVADVVNKASGATATKTAPTNAEIATRANVNVLRDMAAKTFYYGVAPGGGTVSNLLYNDES